MMAGADKPVRSRRRLAFVWLGWVLVAAGLIALPLPVIPTTPFLVAAAWAFSKGSRRFENWLLYHPYLGPPVREFRKHRVIPLRSKIVAWCAMAISLAGLIYLETAPWVWGTALVVILAMSLYLVSCKSRSPQEERPSDAEAERDLPEARE